MPLYCDGRLQLNEHLQSVSNPRVYAAGDAAGVGPPLTPVSSHDAKIVAANLLLSDFWEWHSECLGHHLRGIEAQSRPS